jgi:hypothetical protein
MIVFEIPLRRRNPLGEAGSDDDLSQLAQRACRPRARPALRSGASRGDGSLRASVHIAALHSHDPSAHRESIASTADTVPDDEARS